MLVNAVQEANQGDPDRLGKLLREIERRTSLPDRWRISLYVSASLFYKLVDYFAGVPTAEDLDELAAQRYPAFRRLVTRERALFEDTLRAGLELPPRPMRTTVGGTSRIVYMSVALGVLMENPTAELRLMRSRVARWYGGDPAEDMLVADWFYERGFLPGLREDGDAWALDLVRDGSGVVVAADYARDYSDHEALLRAKERLQREGPPDSH
jgi:hypothetical protein